MRLFYYDSPIYHARINLFFRPGVLRVLDFMETLALDESKRQGLSLKLRSPNQAFRLLIRDDCGN